MDPDELAKWAVGTEYPPDAVEHNRADPGSAGGTHAGNFMTEHHFEFYSSSSTSQTSVTAPCLKCFLIKLQRLRFVSKYNWFKYTNL